MWIVTCSPIPDRKMESRAWCACQLRRDRKGTPVLIAGLKSANDPRWESAVENADLIYFSGGNPGYLYQTMKGSRVWAAAQKAWMRGAVYAGCSAGAMILSRQMPGFRMPGQQPQPAFGILPVKFTIPHFDAIPGMWKPLICPAPSFK
jgi:hypothetical protein